MVCRKPTAVVVLGHWVPGVPPTHAACFRFCNPEEVCAVCGAHVRSPWPISMRQQGVHNEQLLETTLETTLEDCCVELYRVHRGFDTAMPVVQVCA